MAGAKFRYVPHTADVAFIAYGRNFKETVENAALAMFGVMFDLKKLKEQKGKVKTLRITERASSREDMLWFILQKIVSKVDEKRVNAFRFKVNSLSETEGRVVLHGCIFYKPVKEYVALLDVKAVTPHGLEVKRGSAGYSARVLLDV
ncbi:MAG: archease [Candidatus Micrarchaeota archaeon]|nr:archease [Candidatus Micrarchaeota archaeon]